MLTRTPSIRSARYQAGLLVSRYRGFFALCDQGIVSLVNFATGVVIGRACGKAELGAYTLAWTLMTLSTEIIAILTSTPYTVFGPQLSRSRRRRYLGSILVHQLLLSTVLAMAIAGGAVLGFRTGWVSVEMSGVIRMTAVVIVFIGLRECVRRVSFAELRVGLALAIDVSGCVIQVVGILLLLHFGNLTASTSFALLGISSAAVGGGWLFFQRRTFHADTRLYKRDMKRNWRFASWILGSGILSQVARYLYPWLLAAFHGTSVTGVWAACTGIVALTNPVIMGLGNYVLPKIANVYAASGIAAMKRYVHFASLVFTVLILPFSLILAGFGGRILTGVYGNAYAGAHSLVLLLASNTLINALANPYSQGLFTLERAKADTLVNGMWVAMLFTVGVPAVIKYAALGAAATLLVSSSITAAVRIGVFAREVRRHQSNESGNLGRLQYGRFQSRSVQTSL